MAVEEASMVMLSSGERADGLGSKWVMWKLPGDREKDSFWNHSVGPSTVKVAVKTPVMLYAWNGNKEVRLPIERRHVWLTQFLANETNRKRYFQSAHFPILQRLRERTTGFSVDRVPFTFSLRGKRCCRLIHKHPK